MSVQAIHEFHETLSLTFSGNVMPGCPTHIHTTNILTFEHLRASMRSKPSNQRMLTTHTHTARWNKQKHLFLSQTRMYTTCFPRSEIPYENMSRHRHIERPQRYLYLYYFPLLLALPKFNAPSLNSIPPPLREWKEIATFKLISTLARHVWVYSHIGN